MAKLSMNLFQINAIFAEFGCVGTASASHPSRGEWFEMERAPRKRCPPMFHPTRSEWIEISVSAWQKVKLSSYEQQSINQISGTSWALRFLRWNREV